MFVSYEFENILKNKFKYTLVDVRSPGEYKESTIPGAINIPIFSDEEREIIGTLYKEEGREVATVKGIEFISKSLPSMFKKYLDISAKKKLIAVFCQRGGMRSSSIGSLLNSIGISIVKVDKGYKGYRNYILKTMPELVNNIKFITLYGKTGTGKTKILEEIEKLGHPVLDLEKCANHRGSFLGGIGLGEQSSQKNFESLVFDTLYNALDKGYIFTEGESKRIGKIIMPNYLYDALSRDTKILVDADIERRKQILWQCYVNDRYKIDEISNAIKKLTPYVGGKVIDEYIEKLKNNQMESLIEDLMINYYDKSYNLKNKSFHSIVKNEDDYICAQKIIEITIDKSEENENI